MGRTRSRRGAANITFIIFKLPASAAENARAAFQARWRQWRIAFAGDATPFPAPRMPTMARRRLHMAAPGATK